MATRRCPKCKLINPSSTAVCDCGWSFVDLQMTEPRQIPGRSEDEELRNAPGTKQIQVGLIALALGLVVTALTYGMAASSPSGGMYIIAYGPVIFGISSIIRGVAKQRK